MDEMPCDAEFLEDWYRKHGSLDGLPIRTYHLARTAHLCATDHPHRETP